MNPTDLPMGDHPTHANPHADPDPSSDDAVTMAPDHAAVSLPPIPRMALPAAAFGPSIAGLAGVIVTVHEAAGHHLCEGYASCM